MTVNFFFTISDCSEGIIKDSPQSDDLLQVDVGFCEKSVIRQILESDLGNLHENFDFQIELEEKDKEFLLEHPVVFKFSKHGRILGESFLSWSAELSEEISQEDFTSKNFTCTLPIVGHELTIGHFKLGFTVTRVSNGNGGGSADNGIDSIEKDDLYFAVTEDGIPEYVQDGNLINSHHKCVGGLINLTGCAIKNGDTVKLSHITRPDGQLGCPGGSFATHSKMESQSPDSLNIPKINFKTYSMSSHEFKNSDNPELMNSNSEPFTICSHSSNDVCGMKQVKFSLNVHPDGQMGYPVEAIVSARPINSIGSDDGENSLNSQLMSSNQSGSFTFCCNGTFSGDQLSHSDTSITTICSRTSPAKRIILRGRRKKNRSMNLHHEHEDEDCPQIKDALQLLRNCEEDYDFKDIQHRPVPRVDQMKYCYRAREPNLRKRKKSNKYVNWPGGRPHVHYTSHSHCARKADLVPGNMGWKWNISIVGLSARCGWRPGYIRRQIRKLMEYFLIPLHKSTNPNELPDSYSSGQDENRKFQDGQNARVILAKTSVQKNASNSKTKVLRIEVPDAVKSYMEELTERQRNHLVLHMINQGTQYTERDYRPWKKADDTRGDPPKSNRISSTVDNPPEKASKLPTLKKQAKGKPNVNQANAKNLPKASSLKIPRKLPHKAPKKPPNTPIKDLKLIAKKF
ncbi:uncharacterized protein LOC129798803 [Phlebotomus papatasi]|uniref:uncharacterized protein LOC129798803 n=1 Tax=Phlebotomus papatasi TaxID=29031 RepID=UPI002483E0D4|nr:uncharacterized protein LOC129798803 [Phlebotomus papatasi]